MATEIYYFSGTGNSLHIAKELQKKLPDSKLIPVADFLNRRSIFSEAETIGFVFPIHFAATPLAIKKFINKIQMDRTKYVFAIATRRGTTHRAFEDIGRLLKKKGKSLDSFFTINMPGNFPKFKKIAPSTLSQVEIMKNKARFKLDLIQEIINRQDQYHERDIYALLKIPKFFLYLVPIMNLIASLSDRFKGSSNDIECKACGAGSIGKYISSSDIACKGCGNCAKVCLSGKISFENGKPVWNKDVKCLNCYAGINYCPKEAEYLEMKEGKTYLQPLSTIEDIAAQKN